MLFYGPPGTGKTSTILALAKQLYGPAMFSSRVLELNASDERGIAIVREKVKNFARQQLTNPPTGEYRERYPCPPYKIIVLDEADSMTQDAQSALRRTMETYSRITRFCLVCNYVTRIIDPLASRCSKFRFKSLDSGRAEERLKHIADAEGVRLEEGATKTLVKCAEGDLRKAITFLQSAARLANAGALKAKDEDGADEMDIDSGGGKVTAKSVLEIAGTIPDEVIDGLWSAMQPKGKGVSVYTAVAKCVEDLVADGWSGGQTVTQVREILATFLSYSPSSLLYTSPRSHALHISYLPLSPSSHSIFQLPNLTWSPFYSPINLFAVFLNPFPLTALSLPTISSTQY